MSCLVVAVEQSKTKNHPLAGVTFRKARKLKKGYVLGRIPREYLDLVCARLFQLKALVLSDIYETEGLCFIHFVISNEHAAKLASIFPAPVKSVSIGLSKDGRKVLQGLSERRAKLRQTERFNPGLKLA